MYESYPNEFNPSYPNSDFQNFEVSYCYTPQPIYPCYNVYEDQMKESEEAQQWHRICKEIWETCRIIEQKTIPLDLPLPRIEDISTKDCRLEQESEILTPLTSVVRLIKKILFLPNTTVV